MTLGDRGRGWQLGALDAATTRVHLLQSEPGSTRAEIDLALEALDALAARLGSEPYRRLAALERARVTT